MTDEQLAQFVCFGCGAAWGRWLECPVCGHKYVTTARDFRPVQMALFRWPRG